MLQRIQTIFLLFALACMLFLFSNNFGSIQTDSGENLNIYVNGIDKHANIDTETFSVLPLTIIVSIVSIVTLLTIVLYKKRMLQIRLSFFNLVMQLGTMGLMFYYLYNASKQFGTDYSFGFMFIMPLIAMILTFLAIRQIGKDEALVRSIDRIR